MSEDSNVKGDARVTKVTVGVIVRNEAARIRAALEGLAALDFDREHFEVLVVDGNSTDGTPDVVRSLIEEHPEVAIRMVSETGPPSHGNARNVILENARGELVAFTDADCEVPRDWLSKLVGVLESEREKDDRVVAAGGIRYPAPSVNWRERLLNAMLGSYLGSGRSGGFVLSGDKYTDSVGNYNAIYVREVAVAEKYLPVRFAEDFEFNRRLVGKGHRIVISGEPKVFHHQEADFRAFARQMFLYGRGQAAMWRRTGEVRAFAPLAGLFVIGVALGWLSVFMSRWLSAVYLGVIAIYLCAAGMTALSIAIRERAAFGLLAMFVFPLQHVSYGVGFLAGMLKRPA